MRKFFLILLLFVAGAKTRVSAQTEAAEQLLLNVEKLAQLKQILTDLKKGYQIVSTGYNTIKNISEANFHLHQSFLDGLMNVSPAVKKYSKVADIILFGAQIVREYKHAYSRLKQDGNFSVEEVNYLGSVYRNLFNKSLKDLDGLTTVLTANKLRMSDDERISVIDDLYNAMLDKLTFLRHFNNSTTHLALQRAREKKDIITAQKLYGITQ